MIYIYIYDIYIYIHTHTYIYICRWAWTRWRSKSPTWRIWCNPLTLPPWTRSEHMHSSRAVAFPLGVRRVGRCNQLILPPWTRCWPRANFSRWLSLSKYGRVCIFFIFFPAASVTASAKANCFVSCQSLLEGCNRYASTCPSHTPFWQEYVCTCARVVTSSRMFSWWKGTPGSRSCRRRVTRIDSDVNFQLRENDGF